MQYRAIGLVRGRYTASEEQLTQGTLFTEDGGELDVVLLGRVIRLVKKHLDLDQDHLWVVYPRTRSQDNDNDLHLQIAGVWEPEKLHPESLETLEATEHEEAEAPESSPDADMVEDGNEETVPSTTDEAAIDLAGSDLEAGPDAAEVTESRPPAAVTAPISPPSTPGTPSLLGPPKRPQPIAPAPQAPTQLAFAAIAKTQEPAIVPETVPVEDGYFSIRGEVVHQAPEENWLMVKICQAPRKAVEKPKSFKLKIQGNLFTTAVGQFWNFQVQRQQKVLHLLGGNFIGVIPRKKAPPKKKGKPSELDPKRHGLKHPVLKHRQDYRAETLTQGPVGEGTGATKLGRPIPKPIPKSDC